MQTLLKGSQYAIYEQIFKLFLQGQPLFVYSQRQCVMRIPTYYATHFKNDKVKKVALQRYYSNLTETGLISRA